MRVACHRLCLNEPELKMGASSKDLSRSSVRRRRFLITATSAVGGAFAMAVAYPFLMSLGPSERTKAAGAPVRVSIGDIGPGELKTIGWRGKPVWVLRRTHAMLSDLSGHDSELADPASSVSNQPAYCRNLVRSIKPEYFVVIGVCTHLGCSPAYYSSVKGGAGQFFCPCHGSRFDLAGRVFKNVPAPTNLVVPRHGYVSASELLIGTEVQNPQSKTATSTDGEGQIAVGDRSADIPPDLQMDLLVRGK